MEITTSKKRIEDRMLAVANAYNNRGNTAVSIIVSNLAKKLGVSEVTIYADLKKQNLSKGKKSA